MGLFAPTDVSGRAEKCRNLAKEMRQPTMPVTAFRWQCWPTWERRRITESQSVKKSHSVKRTSGLTLLADVASY